jgi:hypothetical protein
VEGVVYGLLEGFAERAGGGNTLFFYILALARSSSFSDCLAEYTHEFAIARNLISPPSRYCFRESDVLVSCESRVCAQVLLSHQLVRGLGLILDYLDSGQTKIVFVYRSGDKYADIKQLHDCGLLLFGGGWGIECVLEGPALFL